MTMGIVSEAFLAATAAAVGTATMTSTLEPGQVGREVGQPVVPPLGISVFKHDVAALDVTEVAKPLPEDIETTLGPRGRTGARI
jgi:hypothetical protein